MNSHHGLTRRIEKRGWKTTAAVALALLVVLPMAGVLLAGRDASRYLEFPPRSVYVRHAPFSLAVFIALSVGILAVVLPFVLRVLTSSPPRLPPERRRPFPWWGWAAVAFGAAAWILAWTRFEWFAGWQPYTFSPLWIAYIVTVNALTYRRIGRCMLTHRARYLLLLFPVSAAFWWFFEYLNRFVQNWHYVGIGDLGPLAYFVYATLPFATVLPAVMGTCDWLKTFPRLSAGTADFIPVRVPRNRLFPAAVLLRSCISLTAIGVLPNFLFPMLWLSPLFLLTSIQALSGQRTLFFPVRYGDWERICRLALSALICGFFWEMWNVYSLAKWEYAVPFVDAFHVFEMPVLGYAGYLPFGLECAVIADLTGEAVAGRNQTGQS